MFYRRGARTLLPRVATPCLLGAAALLVFGLGWVWDLSRQTGNLFLLVLVPSNILSWTRAPLLAAAAVGAWAGIRYGLPRPDPLDAVTLSSTPWARAWAVRVYPGVLSMGLFLIGSGAAFACDVVTSLDRAPGGYALFVYLDYAAPFQRPWATLFGCTLVGAGAWILRRWSFQRLMDRPRPPEHEQVSLVHVSTQKDLQKVRLG